MHGSTRSAARAASIRILHRLALMAMLTMSLVPLLPYAINGVAS